MKSIWYKHILSHLELNQGATLNALCFLKVWNFFPKILEFLCKIWPQYLEADQRYWRKDDLQNSMWHPVYDKIIKYLFYLFQKLPYPKQVFFIVGNEFCERFSYYGMKGTFFYRLRAEKSPLSMSSSVYRVLLIF